MGNVKPIPMISDLSAEALAVLFNYARKVSENHPIWRWAVKRSRAEYARRLAEADGEVVPPPISDDLPVFESEEVRQSAVRWISAFAAGCLLVCPEPELPHSVQDEIAEWCAGVVDALDPSTREVFN